MITQSRDTRPEAERVQIELLRKATTERRLELGLSLCQSVFALSYRGIAQANPSATEEELKLIMVDLLYGKDLADRVRAYLARRRG